MQISQIIAPEGVRITGHSTSKKKLFQLLGELTEQVYGVSAEEATGGLLERESLGSTGVGGGVALPHARVSGISSVRGIFVRLEKPLSFDSVDGQPVDLIIALFAPLDGGADHLKSLALISRTMRDPTVREKLRANDAPGTLYAILSEGPTVQAA